MKFKNNIIAIDPGIKKSGLYHYNGEHRFYYLSFFELINFLQGVKKRADESPLCSFFIAVENSNILNKNWHGITARRNVGKNQGISAVITDYCQSLVGERVIEIAPAGFSKKYKSAIIFKRATNLTHKTNQHERAAFAIAEAADFLIKANKNG